LITYRILFRFAATAGGLFVFSVTLLSITRSIIKIKGKNGKDNDDDKNTAVIKPEIREKEEI
jgi:hypothetical protein